MVVENTALLVQFEKKCTKCGVSKPFTSEHFCRHKRASSGLSSRCKDCHRKMSCDYRNGDREAWRAKNRKSYHENKESQKARSKRYIERHPDRYKNGYFKAHLKSVFGLSLEQYDAMMSSQGGLCAICNSGPRGKHKRLAVDHDHSAGRVRSLLCHQCNAALGYFRDNPEVLDRAAAYLRKWKEALHSR